MFSSIFRFCRVPSAIATSPARFLSSRSSSTPLPYDPEILKPHITVIGVGGAGGNAISNMIRSELSGIQFMVANTDSQALQHSTCDTRIQLGSKKTRGLGAGALPEIGRDAAEESIDEVMSHIRGTNMLFITAGMGGGTGTGAAPVIAKRAREEDILTVGVVTKPFNFEGRHRQRIAESGIQELAQHLDTLIVIPNQNLLAFASAHTTFHDAFRLADSVLLNGVRSITDLIVRPGLINLDFADVRSIMKNAGRALMGTGEATGENRAKIAAEMCITNPLLDQMCVNEARGVLISITGGADLTLFEVDEIANHIRGQVHDEANIIFGSTYDEEMNGKVKVAVIVSGAKLATPENAAAAAAHNQAHHVTTASLIHPPVQSDNMVGRVASVKKPVASIPTQETSSTTANSSSAPHLFSVSPAAAAKPSAESSKKRAGWFSRN